MTEREHEMNSCHVFCEEYYPENPEKLFQWFAEQPEKFSFGMGTATDEELNDGRAPSPIILRQGNTLYFSLGVERGLEEFTQKRMFERRRYELDLATFERKEIGQQAWFQMLQPITN